jgi:hypothetical protein
MVQTPPMARARAAWWRRAGAAGALLLLAAAPAMAASTLSLCPGDAAERAALATVYRDVAGGSVTLRLDAQPPATRCASLALPPAAGDVAAIALLPPAATGGSAETLALQGSRDPQGRLAISQIDKGDGAAEHPVALIAPGRNLVPLWTPRAFGAEERAGVVSDDGGDLTLACRAGTQPAGFTMAYPAALPPLPGLALSVAARGDGGFVVAAADAAAQRRDSPVPLLTLPASASPRWSRAAVPGTLARASMLSWSVLCPAAGGTLTLTRLSLDGAPAVDTRPRQRSAWAWQPALWRDRPAALLDRLGQLVVDRVFVSVPMADDRSVSGAEALARFIRAAAARRIAVWAVEGDPHAVLPSERDKFRGRAAALAAFNRQQPPGARLSGVQFDIEPYLVPGYTLAPERWIEAYLDTLAALGAAARMPVEAAIPFWFPLDRWGERLAGVVGSVALMDYRTRADDIERYAAPVLAWGTVYHRAVHIGLEFGPLGSEERLVFRRAPQGQLWRVTLGGREALVLLREPAESPSGAAYAQASRRDIAEDGLSFRGREAALPALLAALGQAFAPWPSYAGIALHGLL